MAQPAVITLSVAAVAVGMAVCWAAGVLPWVLWACSAYCLFCGTLPEGPLHPSGRGRRGDRAGTERQRAGGRAERRGERWGAERTVGRAGEREGGREGVRAESGSDLVGSALAGHLEARKAKALSQPRRQWKNKAKVVDHSHEGSGNTRQRQCLTQYGEAPTCRAWVER